jgi:hypothetical protein
MSSLLFWELRTQINEGGCGNDYHTHAGRSIIVTKKEKGDKPLTCLLWTTWAWLFFS